MARLGVTGASAVHRRTVPDPKSGHRARSSRMLA